jgi:hypothetical protein
MDFLKQRPAKNVTRFPEVSMDFVFFCLQPFPCEGMLAQQCGIRDCTALVSENSLFGFIAS